MFDMTFKSIII